MTTYHPLCNYGVLSHRIARHDTLPILASSQMRSNWRTASFDFPYDRSASAISEITRSLKKWLAIFDC